MSLICQSFSNSFLKAEFSHQDLEDTTTRSRASSPPISISRSRASSSPIPIKFRDDFSPVTIMAAVNPYSLKVMKDLEKIEEIGKKLFQWLPLDLGRPIKNEKELLKTLKMGCVYLKQVEKYVVSPESKAYSERRCKQLSERMSLAILPALKNALHMIESLFLPNPSEKKRIPVLSFFRDVHTKNVMIRDFKRLKADCIHFRKGVECQLKGTTLLREMEISRVWRKSLLYSAVKTVEECKDLVYRYR